jgi:signal transduction histidine kinase
VRIARELHDIVAHSLSVIAVQSDAAEAAPGRHPELAREPLRAIRSSARDSLGEIRRLLQALRMDEESRDSDSVDPPAGITGIPRLVACS